MAPAPEHLDRLRQAYGVTDPATVAMFGGGYVNFGYWQPPPAPGAPITPAQRAAASASLYDLVLDLLGPTAGQRVVEVGCGLGAGAARAAGRGAAGQWIGVDLVPAQVGRARSRCAGLDNGCRPVFVAGAAESLPLATECADAVVSVEAAQHFVSYARFAAEAARVLRPGGRLVVTTFFATRADALPALRARLPSVAVDFDHLIAIDAFEQLLASAGLRLDARRSLGARVWAPFDAWLAQTEYRDRWERQFATAHRDGLLDYYVMRCRR